MTRMMQRTGLVWAAFLLLVACGGSDDSTIDLPVDDSKQVKDLTGSELKDICAATMSKFKSIYGDTACAAQGLQAKILDNGNCEEVKAACMTEMFDVDRVCAAAEQTKQGEIACEVTVGEIEECFNDTLASFEGKIPTVTCSMTPEQQQELNQADFEPSPAASCDVLQQCDGLDLGFIGAAEEQPQQ